MSCSPRSCGNRGQPSARTWWLRTEGRSEGLAQVQVRVHRKKIGGGSGRSALRGNRKEERKLGVRVWPQESVTKWAEK